ncbi:hypothetical protein D9C73_002199 [Collichthys lucidus]|uniref:Uncharacterized protein n=1 Tax=Collichthys lucidus TaxID=240159 RepID=A0A4U5U338_COLLU|nr:hypothetical protein D9C73_002199 [Collichthys lucidus]
MRRKVLIIVVLRILTHNESKVNFHCQPYRPCEPGKQVKAGKDGKIGHVDPSQTPGREKWEQACARDDQSNTTDPASDSRRALKVQFEVSVELHLTDVVNLTLYSLNNHSSLHLRPPEEEEGQTEDGEGSGSEAFYCCLPSRLASASANQSRCLLWFSNRTVLTTAKETLPWKRTMKGKPKVHPVCYDFSGQQLNGNFTL